MTAFADPVAAVVAKTRVLSLQIAGLNNRVYAEMLRSEFARSPSIDFTAMWSNDRAEPHARVLDQLLRLHGPTRYVRKNNVDVRRVRAELGYAYKARRLLQRMAPAGRYDVLHFHTQTLSLLANDFMHRTPAVVTTDESAFQLSRYGDPRWRFTHVPSERLETRALRAAAFVVVFSRWAADSMIAEHGLSPERVRVVPLGIDLAQVADAVARAVPKASRRKRILFVGDEFVRKGGPLLVDVFRERFASRDVELHVATEPEVEIAPHPDIVVHRDVTTFSPAWKELYANADVFAMPANRLAFGIGFIEAMAFGLPVIGTAIGAVPEIVDAASGFLIAPGDGRALGDRLESLLSDDALRERLGASGAARAARLFDAATCARALGAVFEEAARATRTPT